MGDTSGRSGRLWWIPAALAVGWAVIAVTSIPAPLGWAYVIGNVFGTALGLRLQVARIAEWGDDRPDHRPLLRLLCVAQVPTGWVVLVLALIGMQ